MRDNMYDKLWRWSSSNETFQNSKTCTKHKKISRFRIITFNLLQHEMTDPFYKNDAYSSSKSYARILKQLIIGCISFS